MNARFDFEIVNRVVLDNRHAAFEGCETANQLKLLKEPFAIRARVAWAQKVWSEIYLLVGNSSSGVATPEMMSMATDGNS